MLMVNHLDIGSTAWSVKTIKLPEQGGPLKPDGLFQQYLDSNSDASPEKLTPDSIRALASNLVSALDRAGMHAMFSDVNDSQMGKSAGLFSTDLFSTNLFSTNLFSTDLFISLRNSAKMPLFDGQNRPVNSAVPSSAPNIPAVEVHHESPTVEKPTVEKPVSGQEQYASIIATAAAANGLDPKLIEAVIHTESDFNAKAESPVGAQGLMQLMPGTAAELGVSDAFDPEQSIQAGSKYLKRLMNRYDGDTKLALAAYNWGMGNLERHPDRMPQETVNYVAKITGLMNGVA